MKMYLMACPCRKDLDQPAHLCPLIRAIPSRTQSMITKQKS